MAGNRDPKGYYALLGVPPSAAAGQIKQAYRSRAKALHPDGTGAEADTDAFQRLGEAYTCLGDPEARARYDAAALDAPPPPAPSPAPRAGGGGIRAGTEPVLCSCCGAVSVQPRYVIYWRVISLLLVTLRQPVQGVFCRACADRKALGASAVTWLLGWWGLPWGPFWTVRALVGNLTGGRRPGDANAMLLRHQAVYFVSTGKTALARLALHQALHVVESAELRQQFLKMQSSVGVVDERRFKDHWRPTATLASWLHALPVVALVAGSMAITTPASMPVGVSLAALEATVHAAMGVSVNPGPGPGPGPGPSPGTGESPPPAETNPAPASAPPPAAIPAVAPVPLPASTTPPPAPKAALTASPETPLPPAAPGSRWRVAGNQLAFRAGPASDRPALGRLVTDEVVELVDTTANGWAKIRTATGRTGYVARKFLVPARE